MDKGHIITFIKGTIILYCVRLVYAVVLPWITSNYSRQAAENASVVGIFILLGMAGFEDTHRKTHDIKESLACFVFVVIVCFAFWGLHRALTWMFA